MNVSVMLSVNGSTFIDGLSNDVDNTSEGGGSDGNLNFSFSGFVDEFDFFMSGFK